MHSMSREQILDLLEQHPGSHVSGADLSRALGVSRSAVWKQVETLRGQGYGITGGPNQGYLLERLPDLLYPREIQKGLQTSRLGRQVYHFRSVSSTNQVAQDLGRRGYPEGTLVVAEEQTAGRGRWQRSWWSPPETGIWLSLVLRPQLAPYRVSQITLVAGVSCVRAIDACLGLRPGIKWPNDIVYDGRKLCGILVEMEAAAEQVHFLVIGIGINVNQELEEFPEEIRDSAISLGMIAGRRVERLLLVQRFLEAFEEDYDHYCRDGFAAARQAWLSCQVTLGKAVRVQAGREEFTGEACGLDDDGSLLVRLGSGQVRRCIAGEVTFVRGQ
jgi:BirA family biotin operon repressor/biotin-[acetyl-CoA-carboxylase] ligase